MEFVEVNMIIMVKRNHKVICNEHRSNKRLKPRATTTHSISVCFDVVVALWLCQLYME